MADTRSLKIEILGDARGGTRAINKISRELGGMQGSMGAAATAGKMAFAAIAGGAVALGAGMAYSVNIFRKFEQSLNVFQAVSSATGDEMGKVSKLAKQLGKDITLPGTSAKDAADAMTELAKGGLNVRQSMDAAKGVLRLSAAAGIDNAQAATIAANALNTFHLKASEATRVSDLLAAASNASSAEITDVAEAFQMAGAVFASNRVPIQDLTTEIALMANAGIKGSDAGTSLKTMMMRLAAPTEDAKGALDALGISVYDATGKMRSQRDIIKQFEKATKGMSDEQRNARYQIIFGADAIRAATVIYGGGVDAFDKMSTAVTKEGAAAQLAAAKNKGLTGQIDAIKSTLETWAITIGENVAPLVVTAFIHIQKAIDYLAPKVSRVAAEIGDIWPRVQSAIGAAVPRVIETLKAFGQTVYTNIIEPSARVLAAIGRVASEMATLFGPGLVAIIGTLGAVAYKAVGGGLQLLADALELVSRHGEIAIPAIAGFVGAMATMKIAGVVAPMVKGLVYELQFLNLVRQEEGVQGLAKALGASLNPAVVGVTAVLGLATYAFMQHRKSQEESKTRVKELTEAMREQTGTIKDNVETTIVQQLEEKHRIDDLRRLGITTQTYTDAVLGSSKAQATFNNAVKEYQDKHGKMFNDIQGLADAFPGVTRETAKAAQAEIDLAVSTEKLTEAQVEEIEARHKNKDGTINYAGALEDVRKITGETGDEMEDAATKADLMRAAFDRVSGGSVDLLTATNNYKLGLIQMTEHVLKNKGHLEANTAAGFEFSNMLVEQAQKGKDVAIAMENMGRSNEDIKTHLQGVSDALADQMRQAGWTEDAIKDFQTQLGLTPEQIAVTISVHKANAEEALNAFKAKLNEIRNTARVVLGGFFGKLPSSWPTDGNATGGIPRTGLGWVGEKGPELVDWGRTAPISRVYTHEDSMAMVSAGGSSRQSAAAAPVYVTFNPSVATAVQREFMREVYDGLVDIQRRNGGRPISLT